MKTLRTAAIAAFSASVLLTTGVPAFADDPVDTTPPVVSDTGLVEDQWVGVQSVFKPTFSDDREVMLVETLADGKVRNQFSGTTAARQVFVNLSGWADGSSVDVTVRATDRAHNTGSKTTRVRVDTVAPTATFSPPFGSPVSGPITIKAKVPDDTVSLVLSVDGVERSRVTSAPWEVPWEAGSSERPTLTITDKGGNRAEYQGSYQADTTGPEIDASENWIRPLIGPGQQVMAVSSVTDPAGMDRVEWWIDGALRGAGEGIDYDFGQVSRTATVEVRAFDKLGNLSTLTRPVQVDATAPTVNWVSPAANALVRGSTITSTIRPVDANGLGSATLDGWAHPGTSQFTGTVRTAADGPQVLTWLVTDAVGNLATAKRTVLVDNTRPVLKVTKAPANNAKVKGTVAVTATATDRNGVARVQLLINGKLVATDYRAGYAFSVNTAKYGKTFKIQLRAYDKAGNSIATSSRTWRR